MRVSKFFVTALVALVALTFTATAFANGFGVQMRTVGLVKDGVVGTDQADSTSFSIPTAATGTAYPYTKAVDITDLDPAAGVSNLGTTARVAAFVCFSHTSDLWAVAADSMRVYFQTSENGTDWSALSAVQLGTATSGDEFFKVPILATQTGAGNNTVDGAKFIRFHFGGDTGAKFFGNAVLKYYALTNNIEKPGQ